MLWCEKRKAWMDRDVYAALNLSMRRRLRFDRSPPKPKSRSQQTTEAEEKGLAGEAVRRNGTRTLILRVDASKMCDWG
jgi:hypothetical protein